MFRSDKIIFLILVFTWSVLSSSPVFAQAATISDVLTNAYGNLKNIPIGVSSFAYIVGLFVGASGIYDFRKHVDNPNSTPLRTPIVKLIAAGLFLSLPYLSEAVVSTVFGKSSGGTDLTTASGYATGTVDDAVDGMIYRFITNIHGPMITLLTAFSYIAATFFLVNGISKIVKVGQEGPRAASAINIVTTFVVAGVLFAVGDMSSVFTSSLFGDSTIKTYAVISQNVVAGDDNARIAAIISSLVAFIGLVGFIAFIRGWLVLKKVAEGGNASLTQAIVFLVAGTLALNIGSVVNIVENTIGLTGANSISFQ